MHIEKVSKLSFRLFAVCIQNRVCLEVRVCGERKVFFAPEASILLPLVPWFALPYMYDAKCGVLCKPLVCTLHGGVMEAYILCTVYFRHRWRESKDRARDDGTVNHRESS